MAIAATSIDHVVVLMLENRSYDNVLGWLYNSDNAPPYHSAPTGQQNLNGLNGSETNPQFQGNPVQVANQTSDTSVNAGFEWPATTIPLTDPGEPFDDMAQQFTGSTTKPGSNPYPNWSPDQAGAMQGFVYNYQTAKAGAPVQDVMNYFTPNQLPVTAWLANQYSVCDNWFASMPTQTFSNRMFGHCAAPGVSKKIGDSDYFSLADDPQYLTDKIEFVDMPSVFAALDINPPPTNGSDANWKLYFHDYSISVMTLPYLADIAKGSGNINISTFDDSDWGTTMPKQLNTLPDTFVTDLANGTLPPYSFIEPRYSSNYGALHGRPQPAPAPNSNHPGPADYPPSHVSDHVAPIDVSSGELLVMRLYNMLRNSDIWQNCLLIVTYDEHGGTYDHQAPPSAVSPGTINWINGNSSNPPFTSLPSAQDDMDKTADGFSYNVLGGRVPTLVISPFVAGASTAVSANGVAFDHSSLVRTVLDTFAESGTSLTQRDASAPSLLNCANISANNVNTAGLFEDVMIAAPGALAFHATSIEKHLQQILQAGSGGTNLTISVSSANTPWLSVQASSSTENGFELLQAVVNVDASGLSSGNYSGTLSLSDDNGTTRDVAVSLFVSFI